MTSDDTAQKMKFYIKDFFSKCDQIRSWLLTYSSVCNCKGGWIPLLENFYRSFYFITFNFYKGFFCKSRQVVVFGDKWKKYWSLDLLDNLIALNLSQRSFQKF